MMRALQNRLDAFFGRAAAAVTVPSMDGALRPNSLLETAPLRRQIAAPDNLVAADGEIVFSDGTKVFALPSDGRGEARERLSAPKPVACLAASAGGLAVGMSGEIRIFGGRFDGKSFTHLSRLPVLCPTALTFERPNSLIVCLGSQSNPPEEWKRDLLQRNASGSVWRLDLEGGAAEPLARDLAYPSGALAREGGELWVSEAWQHRVLRLRTGTNAQTLVEDLPAYPSRLAPSSDGGAWVVLFAPRRQMVEFVLREKAYRERMMREVHPDFWLAPALNSGKSFLEPIQGGQVKHLGIVKPWGPTRSYGLVIRLDAAGIPTASLHSRADGTRHGVTSCLEGAGRLLVASKGGDAVVEVDLAELDKE